MKFKNIVSNKIFTYTISRYGIYALQFFNSLAIAVLLGPEFLGVWGFVTLVIQYFSQLNFGISYAFNNLSAINKSHEPFVSDLLGKSIILLSILSILFSMVFAIRYSFDLNFGAKYNFANYSFSVFLIAILGNFTTLYTNVFRLCNRLIEITLSQALPPLLMFVFTLFLKGERLLEWLVYSNVISFAISTIIFVLRSPLKPSFKLNVVKFKRIIKIGINLFIYNSSFYFLIISTRSIISWYSSTREFGRFSFSFSMASTVLLLLDSVNFLIYPKLLNRLGNANNDEANRIIKRTRLVYIYLSQILIHTANLVFSISLIYFVEYRGSEKLFGFVSITLLVYTNSFGYATFLIAKGREKLMGGLAIMALVVNVGLCYGLSLVMSFEYIILGTLISYIAYVFTVNAMALKYMKLPGSFVQLLSHSFPLETIVPSFISLVVSVTHPVPAMYIIPIIVFGLLGLKNFRSVLNELRLVFSNKKLLEI